MKNLQIRESFEISRTDADGYVTNYTYNNLDMVTSINYNDGEEVSCVYNAVGAYTFDETNRMVNGTNELGESSAYLFNGLGALVENTWTIKKNAYGYHDVSSTEMVEGEIVVDSTSGKKEKKNKKDPEVVEASPALNQTSTVVKEFVVDYTTETFEPLMEHEVNGLDYRYVYGNDRLSVNISGVETSSGNLIENGNQIRLYYHMDYLGTADYLTSPVSLKVTSWTHYNEWGEITHNAVLKCGQRELDLVKRYATHDYDAALGLYYAKARFYDPQEGRFLSVDPARDGNNWYVYVANDPVVWIDPLGLWQLSDNELSFSDQLQMLALTEAYYKGTPEIQEVVSGYADFLRENMVTREQTNPNAMLPVVQALTEHLTENGGYMSKADFCRITRNANIEFIGSPNAYRDYIINIGLSQDDFVPIFGYSDRTSTEESDFGPYYGGNQAWTNYSSTGCGPVALADILTYLMMHEGELGKKAMTDEAGNLFFGIPMEDYVETVHAIVDGLSIVPIMTAGQFRDAATLNPYLDVQTRVMDNRDDFSTAIKEISRSLMSDTPVAMQVLNNSHDDDGGIEKVTAWHWTTITEIQIPVFDQFEEVTYTYASWGKRHQGILENAWGEGENIIANTFLVFFYV